MKKITAFSLVILFVFATSFFTFAHPGRTDSRGGHRNSSTGDYHYHHGYPEHEHINGICPYKSNSKTESTTINSNNSSDLQYRKSWLIAEEELSKAQQELSNYKERYNSVIYVTLGLCTVLVLVFAALIRINNKKNKIEENNNSIEAENDKLKKEVGNSKEKIEWLKNEINKQDDLNCELIYERNELKEQINQIETNHNREVCNAIHKIQSYIAEHLGLVSFPMLPSESVSDYFIRILLSEHKNPLHFADTKFINKEQEKQGIIYARFIKFKYENKGYRVTIFDSKYTKEKYLFASNFTTLLLIQCIYTTNELSNVEHIQALNNTLIDIKRMNNLENVNAILICNSPISNDVKDLLSKYKFNYRENISLNIKKDK